MEKVKDAVFNLDMNMESINSQAEILYGVKDLLHDVKELLAETLQSGDSMIPITSINGKILAIHELMRFSLDGLYNACEEAGENKDVLFQQLIKGKEKISA